MSKPCVHWWVIGELEGQTSHGICKFCGAERDFLNYLARDTGYVPDKLINTPPAKKYKAKTNRRRER